MEEEILDIQKLKQYVRKLINNYDVSDIYDDHVIFYGVELNSMINYGINFRFCDRVVASNKNNGFLFKIYHEKNSEPIDIEV